MKYLMNFFVCATLVAVVVLFGGLAVKVHKDSKRVEQYESWCRQHPGRGLSIQEWEYLSKSNSLPR